MDTLQTVPAKEVPTRVKHLPPHILDRSTRPPVNMAPRAALTTLSMDLSRSSLTDKAAMVLHHQVSMVAKCHRRLLATGTARRAALANKEITTDKAATANIMLATRALQNTISMAKAIRAAIKEVKELGTDITRHRQEWVNTVDSNIHNLPRMAAPNTISTVSSSTVNMAERRNKVVVTEGIIMDLQPQLGVRDGHEEHLLDGY